MLRPRSVLVKLNAFLAVALVFDGATIASGKPRLLIRRESPVADVRKIIASGAMISVESFITSPDGRRVAYAAQRGTHMFVVVDNVPSPAYEGIGEGMMFSPDSKRVAYVGIRDGKQVAVVDGKEGPTFPFGGGIAVARVFSPDSRRFAYGGIVPKPGGSRHVVVVDGAFVGEYDAVSSDLVFSSDSQRLAFSAQIGSKWCVVLDGRPGPLYDSIGKGSLKFSPDGKRVAYVVTHGSDPSLVVDGEEMKIEGTTVGGPFFSPAGKLVYALGSPRKWSVFADGKAGSVYEGIGDSIVFSPDGNRIAYVAAKSGRDIVVVDGKEEGGYAIVDAQRMLFSPDGKHLAYLAAYDKSAGFVVVDGVPGQKYSSIQSLVFSPDSKYIAYLGARGASQFVVVGEMEIGHESIIGKVVFDGPRVLHTLGMRGEKVVRIELQIVE